MGFWGIICVCMKREIYNLSEEDEESMRNRGWNA